jgi:hypothetical protein
MYTKLLTPTDILVIDLPNQTNPDMEADAVVEQNVATLQSATNLNGDPFVVHRVVIPSVTSLWIYRTYTNSVIVNHVAMVPIYGRSTDQPALDVYQSILGPTYKVVGIDSSQIVPQGGAVHCTTMQIASACGNATIEKLLFEECDGQSLDGKSCAALGLPGGELSCDPDTCKLNTAGCVGAAEAGAEPQPDAAIEVGTWQGDAADAASEMDVGPDSNTRAPEPVVPQDVAAEDGSCGCRTIPTRGMSGWWSLVGVMAAAWTRRRRSQISRRPQSPRASSRTTLPEPPRD